MEIFNNISTKVADWSATVVGLAVAIAQAGYNIDWLNFEFKKEWPKLLFSVVIAAGGYFSTIKKQKDAEQSLPTPPSITTTTIDNPGN